MNSPNFSQLSTNQQMQNPILQSVLILIVLIVFGWFVLGPKFTKSNATRDQLANLEAQRANLEADQQDLNRLITKLEDSDQEIKILDEAVPLTARPTKIAVLLETFAQNSGITISQMSINNTSDYIASGNKSEAERPYQANRGLETIDVSITSLGTVDQFKNFLTLLEQSGRIIDVDTLSVTAGDTGDTFNLRLKTYAYELVEVSNPVEGVVQ